MSRLQLEDHSSASKSMYPGWASGKRLSTEIIVHRIGRALGMGQVCLITSDGAASANGACERQMIVNETRSTTVPWGVSNWPCDIDRDTVMIKEAAKRWCCPCHETEQSATKSDRTTSPMRRMARDKVR